MQLNELASKAKALQVNKLCLFVGCIIVTIEICRIKKAQCTIHNENEAKIELRKKNRFQLYYKLKASEVSRGRHLSIVRTHACSPDVLHSRR